MKRIVIVGGGIAGLALALGLRDRAAAAGVAVDVRLFEASERVGGHVRTSRRDGWIVEWGANGWLDDATATSRLIDRLGLEGELVKADPAASTRYLFRHGRLMALPRGPLQLLTSPILGLAGRLRMIMEPFARSPPARDESVYDFGRRRLGRAAAEVLLDAMVSGVFAGNVRELSIASAFPTVAAMERDHGSLLRALLVRSRRSSRPTLTTFRDGLDRWIAALERELGDAVHLHHRVASIERTDSARWRIELAGSSALGSAPGRSSLDADAVVLALPAGPAAAIVDRFDPDLARPMREIGTASLAVAALGYPSRAVPRPLDGFGFLVPRGSGPRILGCLWDSSIFPGRAPAGKVLLRAMVGGAHDAQAVTLEDDELVDLVRRDLWATMGIEAEPDRVRLFRHTRGIAQYTLGHGERMRRIERRLAAHSGLWACGSSYRGVSLNACIADAARQTERIWSALLDHEPTRVDRGGGG